jgi:hypothetical protein
MKAQTRTALTALAIVLGSSTAAMSQSVENGVLIIEAPKTSASMVLDPTANEWKFSTRGYTCLDDFDSVDQAIDQAADSLNSAGGLTSDKVNEIIDGRSSTDNSVAISITVIGAPAPGESSSDTIKNCFRTATQADIDKLKEALGQRIFLTAIAKSAKARQATE